jgi:hypothetical protein
MNTSAEFFSLNITNVPASKVNPGYGQDTQYSFLVTFVSILVFLVVVYTTLSCSRNETNKFDTGFKEVNIEFSNSLEKKINNQQKLKEKMDHFQIEQEKMDLNGHLKMNTLESKIPSLEAIINSKNLSARNNPFLVPSTSKIELSMTNIFSLQSNLKSLAKPRFQNEMKNSFEMTLDLVRFTCMIMILNMSMVFLMTMTSKVFTDEVTKAYYLTGFHATWLQIALYIPDIFLFIGGYLAAGSVYRLTQVLYRKDFIDYVEFKR